MTGRGPVPVVADDTHRRHDPPFELNAGQSVSPVWESPARHDRILAALAEAGHGVVVPDTFDDAALHAVHDPDMVAFLRDGYAAWRAADGTPGWATGRAGGGSSRIGAGDPAGGPGAGCGRSLRACTAARRWS